MAQSHSETINLHRAENGHDLWAAVEAAQYARLIDHDEPRTDAEAARMQDFVGFFSDCAEHWEGKSTADQAVALAQLGNHLAALEDLRLFVYWAITQRRLETSEGVPVDLPVAVLRIARNGRPSVTLDLPGATEIG